MSENSAKKIEKLSFEEALGQLEGIVRELESGAVKLDDAVKSYEKAVKLKEHCMNKLKDATLKVEKIEINKNGEISTSLLDGVEE